VNKPIEIGYTAGGGRDIRFWGAFTITNPEIPLNDLGEILFEYGHDYDLEQPFGFETHVFEVYISESYNENTTLYSLEIEDFATEKYYCSLSSNFMWAKVTFYNSFTLEINPEDFIYEKGQLHFRITRGYDDQEAETIAQYEEVVVYFIKDDISLLFTTENPHNEDYVKP
jgi:hypothetical protein